MLLAPLLASLGAIFGAVDNSVRRCLLATACSRLPASLGGTKCGCIIAGGIWIGDVAWLLGGVPKIVTVFILAQVSRAHASLVSLGFDAPAPPPQWGLG
jgi:hypothetical protein